MIIRILFFILTSVSAAAGVWSVLCFIRGRVVLGVAFGGALVGSLALGCFAATQSDPPSLLPLWGWLAGLCLGAIPGLLLNYATKKSAKRLRNSLFLIAVAVGPVLSSGAGIGAEEGLVAEAPRRTLRFPKDRSLGRVYVQGAAARESVFFEPGTTFFLDSLGPPDWELCGAAHGDVPVAPGQRVKLIVDADAWQDLSSLQRLAPDDLYEISLGRTDADDRMFAALSHLTGLRSLNLAGTAFTDRGLAKIHRLHSLKCLALPDRITDGALASLARLPKLESLMLPGRQLNGSGMVHLGNIVTLRVLVLNGQSGLPDAALAPSAGLPGLESLSLDGASQIESNAELNPTNWLPVLSTPEVMGEVFRFSRPLDELDRLATPIIFTAHPLLTLAAGAGRAPVVVRPSEKMECLSPGIGCEALVL